MKVESYYQFTSRPLEVMGCPPPVPPSCKKCCAKNGCMYASPEVQQSCLKDECRHLLPNCPSCCNEPGKYLINKNINKRENNMFSALALLHNVTQSGNFLFLPIPLLLGNFEHIFFKTRIPSMFTNALLSEISIKSKID